MPMLLEKAPAFFIKTKEKAQGKMLKNFCINQGELYGEFHPKQTGKQRRKRAGKRMEKGAFFSEESPKKPGKNLSLYYYIVYNYRQKNQQKLSRMVKAMILHLGGEFCCFFEDVLFVLKADGCGPDNRNGCFLQEAQKRGHLIVIEEKQIKSYVVISTPDGEERIYASPISATTLKKRAERNDQGVNLIL